MQISKSVVFTVTALTALFFFALAALVIKGQKAKPVTGVEGIVGETGEATGQLTPTGFVRVHGELWKAEAVSGPINEGDKIRVKAIKDLKLFVEPVSLT